MLATAQAATLADLIPASRARTAALVVGAAAFTALCAQVSIHLWFTPVPITLQTFAVLLAGAGLGAKAGASSQLLYVGAGAVGLPVFAPNAEGMRGGWEIFTGATGGYLVGFVLAAAIVGALADRRHDREVLTSLSAMLVGSVVIYMCGVWWLAHHAHVDAATALDWGLVPFLAGDAVKLVAAGLLLPAAWNLAGRTRS